MPLTTGGGNERGSEMMMHDNDRARCVGSGSKKKKPKVKSQKSEQDDGTSHDKTAR